MFNFDMSKPFADAQKLVIGGDLANWNTGRCSEVDALKNMKRDLKKCKSTECRNTLILRIKACKKYKQEQAEAEQERIRRGNDNDDDDDDEDDDNAGGDRI
jgi:hypothetical protein